MESIQLTLAAKRENSLRMACKGMWELNAQPNPEGA